MCLQAYSSEQDTCLPKLADLSRQLSGLRRYLHFLPVILTCIATKTTVEMTFDTL
jgi:hypothetical protein